MFTNRSPDSLIAGKLGNLDVGDNVPVRIMGVINLTGDSFYSGSVRKSLEDVKSEVLRMEAEGADVIDLGARSTAPYKKFDISVSEEEKVLQKAIRIASEVVKVPVSADTTRFAPAKAALESGATILNHVYGLLSEDSDKIARLIASREASVIVSAHESEQVEASQNPIDRVVMALSKSLDFCRMHGIPNEKISIDPGVGFFETDGISSVDWNVSVLAELEKLLDFHLPICVGVSRKRFLGELSGGRPQERRLFPSIAAASISVYNGAHIIRTHDVPATKEAAIIAKAIREKKFIRSRP